MKSVLKYPGAKWACADWIISCFPYHQHYVEPFFGSGAVFFNKIPVKHEVINDLNGDVVNLFRVIREHGADLAALIEMTPWAREEYGLSYEPCDDPLERARRFIVRNQQAYAGKLSESSGWYTQGAKALSYQTPAYKWRGVPDRIINLIDRLRDCEIEHKPAIDVITRHAGPDVLIYADPPYVWATRNSRAYTHEMTDADHTDLLDVLDAHPGPVVLSSYACPLYDGRLAHWSRHMKEVQAEKGNKRTEVLWLNPICVERLGYGPLFEV